MVDLELLQNQFSVRDLSPGTIHDGCMNQKLLSGLTAALLVSAFGTVPSSYADPSKTVGEQSGVASANSNGSTVDSTASLDLATHPTSQAGAVSAELPTVAPSDSGHQSNQSGIARANQLATSDGATDQKVSSPTEIQPSALTSASTQAAPSLIPSQPTGVQPAEVVKVGAYQSQAALRVDTVATIQPHALRGRQAATLYVRNIPVLTFLGASLDAASNAVTPNAATIPPSIPTDAPSGVQASTEVKIASVQSVNSQAAAMQSIPAGQRPDKLILPETAVADSSSADSRDPVWRATTTAARLNQLYRDKVDASDIRITWDNDRRKYLVMAKEVEIIALDADTVLPDTVSSDAGDLLQATNRIRRQMGNASPLSRIEGDPNGFNQVSVGPVSLRISGYASWYGPGFDGSYSASGERFNSEALTAAHPSLPFGTQIRVTNMDNGESVIVRVTDRGPYSGDRVIDLSAGAARVIGLIQSGVAPVSLEVLAATRSASN